MGVELAIYRIRIGLFGPGRGQNSSSLSKKALNKMQYNPFTRVASSDIHYRILLTYLVLGSILLCCTFAQRYCTDSNFNIFAGYDRCGTVAVHTSWSLVCAVGHITDINLESCSITYDQFSESLLILSSDIETNPGPVDNEALLAAIKSSEDRVLGELRTVKSEIQTIREDLTQVKEDQQTTKKDLYYTRQMQNKMSSDLQQFQSDIQEQSELREQMQLDIDYLSDHIDQKVTLVEKLDKDIDRLESLEKADSMRIFGLSVEANESSENLKEYVVNNVLNVACPEEEWQSDDLKRVFRVGNQSASDDNPPLVIARFRYDDDKFKVFRGREELRNQGIRVSNDLTSRQRDKLKALKEKGKTGYFYKGELKVRPEKKEEYVAGREFRKVVRPSTKHIPQSTVNNSEDNSEIQENILTNGDDGNINMSIEINSSEVSSDKGDEDTETNQ